MTLPEPPLPTIRQLVRAVFPGGNANRGRPVYWYATASEALAAAIQALGRTVVWFPAYFCNEALRFVRRLPIDLRFYDLQPDLTADWDRLEHEIRNSEHSSLLVLVHYFGFPNHPETARDFCNGRSIALLEDAAHTVMETPGIGCGSAVLFSPRKLFAVPRGGQLLMDECRAGSLPRPAPGNLSDIWSWAARRLIQGTMSKAGLPWHLLPAYRHPPLAGSVNSNHNGFKACSPYLQRLISVAERDIQVVIAARRAHYLELVQWVGKRDEIQPIFTELPLGVCPYVFPVLIKANVQHWIDTLRSKGVPASRWPDLPMEVQDPVRFSRSVALAERTVLLPVHQSLTARQVERMGKLLASVSAAAGK